MLFSLFSLLANRRLRLGCAAVSTADWQSAAQAGVYQVHGAIIHPGTFNLSPSAKNVTLGEAIRRSGGFKPGNEWDDGGNPDTVRLSAAWYTARSFEYTLRAAPGGQRRGTFLIRPGDYDLRAQEDFLDSPVPVPLPYAN